MMFCTFTDLNPLVVTSNVYVPTIGSAGKR